MTQTVQLSPDNYPKQICSETHCFGIFKPDALSKGIVPDISREIGHTGLLMVNRRVVHLTADDVMTIWPCITTPHVSRTVPYMTSSPVEVFTVQGEQATLRMLNIKREFRSQYPSENPVISIMHTTDHDDELNRCMTHFFGDEQYVA